MMQAHQTVAEIAPRIAKAQEEFGGHNLRTGGGKITPMEGSPPPQRIAITQWESLDEAQAFFKSKVWTDLGPERDKALVNNRVPRFDGHCTLCCSRIERGYVRDPHTRLIYCAADCFTEHTKDGMSTLGSAPRSLTAF
jgi:uncharacterized protein (DUF1330 family)